MNVGTVTTANTATAQLQENRRQTPDPQATRSRAAEEETRARNAERQQASSKPPEKPPAPVINAQGQTTGTIINTSA